jgi:dihydrofolate reductase
MDIADKLILTEVHEEFDGDTFFPEIDRSVWMETSREEHQADEKNKYNFAFVQYERKN